MSNAISHLIPKPREIETKPGSFAWGEDPLLVLEEGNEEDRFAAQTLERACREHGLAAPQVREVPYAPEKVGDFGNAPAILAGDPCRHLPLLRAMREEGLKITKEIGDEGYLLHVTPKRVIIAGNTPAAVFYGIQTLIQLLPEVGEATIPCVSIRDWPSLKQRGVSMDLARGEVHKPEAIKEYIGQIARYKINMLVFYIENAFLFPSHPDIGSERDRLTTKEVRDIDAWAIRHHITLIPALDSPGHMERFFADPKYEYLAEGTSDPRYKHVISVTHPEAYSFLRDLYTDISKAFSAPYHMMCGDEAFGLGKDRSKSTADAYGTGNLHVRHIKIVRRILAELGKRTFIAADPFEPDFFKAFGIENHGLEALYQVPRDVIVVPWHYNRVEKFTFGDTVKELGFEQHLWAAFCDYNGMFPQTDDAAENIESYVPYAHRIPTAGALCSNWGDRNSFREYNWPMTVFYSEWAWECPGRTRDELLPLAIERFYGPGTGSMASALRFLGAPARYFGWSAEGIIDSPGFKMFYNPIAPRALDKAAYILLQDFRRDSALAREAFREAKAAARYMKDDLDYFEFALDQFDAMGDLVECRHLMAQEDEESRDALVDLLEEAADSVMDLQERYEALWLRERRPRGLEVNSQNFENLLKSIEVALERLG